MSSISDFRLRFRWLDLFESFAGAGLVNSDLISSFLDLRGVFSFLIESVFPISFTDDPAFRPKIHLFTEESEEKKCTCMDSYMYFQISRIFKNLAANLAVIFAVGMHR
jgi:hypothetical protein